MPQSTNPTRDPLAPTVRASRVASWGPATAHAVHLADKLVSRFSRDTGSRPEAAVRSHADAQHRPPTIPGSRLTGGDIDAIARIAPVHSNDPARRAYSLGKSWPDLFAARGDVLERAVIEINLTGRRCMAGAH
ncbi:MAG: hypothetical protein ABI200_01270, partial [Gaiellales bacterium]